ncbi:hypothetical protein QS468_53645 [Bacillus subtilis]|nr:hypothetical protein [Pseudomonas sp. A29(2023)]MDL5601642.1 hypothetical protein [Bacillus subtilis]
MRDLGAAGEHYFSAWCAASGMTANKAVSDRNGWDIFVEVDKDVSSTNPMLIHEGLMEIKVQVKSTDKNNKFVDVELSNLRKMATTALPSFYVLLEFNGSETPIQAYLCHVDKSLIRKILERIAQLLHEDRKVKLNKKFMRLRFSENITPLSPTQLKSMILGNIGTSHIEYMEEKRKFLASTGFEEGTHKVNFTVSGGSQLEKLIDLSLGKSGEVEITDMKAHAIRFGLSQEQPLIQSETAVLSMPEIMPSAEGTLTFRDKSTGRSIVFPARLYQSAFNGWVPDEFKKVRFDADVFELHLSKYGQICTVTASVENAELSDVETVLKLYKLISMLWKPENIKLTFRFQELVSSVDMNPGEGFADCSTTIEALEKVVKIKRYFEIDHDFPVTLSEVDKKHRHIHQINCLIDEDLSLVFLDFTLDVGPNHGVDVDCFYVLFFELGGYIFVELILFTGIVLKEETKYILKPESKRSLYRTVFRPGELNKEVLKAELLEAMESNEGSRSTIDLIPYFLSKAPLS